MTQSICPGQDSRYWKPGDIFEVKCSACGSAVEFFKDEVSRWCRCGERIENPRVGLGCARWCGRAAQCLGRNRGDAAVSGGPGGAAPLRDRLIESMKSQFGNDGRRIAHALAVLSQAEAIRREQGGDGQVVVAAALLHDIGIQEAERKHGSSAPRYQEIEGPPIARRIMERLGMDGDVIEHVCRIVGSHHSARDIDTLEFRIIWDGDAIVNVLEGETKMPETEQQVERFIGTVFRTEAGRERARTILSLAVSK
jgi:putative nucleotidyltransferase with HDIG domain